MAFVPVSVFVPKTSLAPTKPRRHWRPLTTASASRPNLKSPAQTLATAALAAAAASLFTLTPGEFVSAPLTVVPPAEARNGGAASFFSSGVVNKDPASLLRWSLPISNKNARLLQAELEGAVNDLRGLKWLAVEGHVKKASYIINNQTAKILTDVPEDRATAAADLLTKVADMIPRIETAVTEKSADKVTRFSREALASIGAVEQLMVTGFPFEVPQEYSGLPQLKGRATVELLVRKGGDEVFDINGVLSKEGKMTLVLDGYSAPVSAGNFIDLVDKGVYNTNDILRSDGFIVQAGKPKDGEGFKDPNTGTMRTIPLEVFAKGDKEPTYGLTLEDDGRGTESTVLPFTAYGTLAVARNEVEANSGSSQFFWFLFEPDLTPAGRNLMDGNWAVMGYTTKGEEFLRGLQKGDTIVSAKVVDGLENLKR